MNQKEHQYLELRDASIGYPGHDPVLTGVSFAWKTGGIQLLVGRNGAGKSTLIRTLAGLIPPCGGRVTLDGESLESMSSRERANRMAYVHSTPPRSSELQVGEVLQLLDCDEKEARQVLQEFGEESWWSLPLSRLSDGEAQRVMVARCILQRTDWILLDEPTAFLDAVARRTFWDHLERAAQRGRGILVATHDILELHTRPLASVTLISGQGLTELDASLEPAAWTSKME